jgi:hypothetical protein
MHTIRIKKEATRRLVFEVLNSTGELMARSTSFDSICKREDGLSTLMAAARANEVVTINFDGTVTSLTAAGRKSRVLHEGELHRELASVLLAGILDAVVADHRPTMGRRSDLGGPLSAVTN